MTFQNARRRKTAERERDDESRNHINSAMPPLQGLSVAGLRAAVARPVATRKAGARQQRGIRAEIKKITAPDGSNSDSGKGSKVTFRDPPVFDRASTKTGIVHIGVGGFHRSHQQVRCECGCILSRGNEASFPILFASPAAAVFGPPRVTGPAGDS